MIVSAWTAQEFNAPDMSVVRGTVRILQADSVTDSDLAVLRDEFYCNDDAPPADREHVLNFCEEFHIRITILRPIVTFDR